MIHGTAVFFRTLAISATAILVVTLAWGCAGTVMSGKETSESPAETQPEPKVGGGCQYESYPGQAEILSLAKAESPETAGETGVERFEVRFSFGPDGPIKQDWVKVAGKTFLLTLPDGQLPDKELLDKRGIAVGRKTPCLLKVITKGTCTPLIFTWPSDDE